MDSLAKSKEKDVLLLWQGLGYYSRVLHLREIAIKLGRIDWPLDLQGWLALPGIGRTTAGGILSTAWDRPFPILDGNVQRLLSRLIASPSSPKRSLPFLWKLSEALLYQKRPRDFNQALMDLGSQICTPPNPRCELCPWSDYCLAYSLTKQRDYPIKMIKKSLPFQVIGLGVLVNENSEVLIDQRLQNGSLGGLWEFPGGKQKSGEPIVETIARELMEEMDISVEVGDELITLDHAFSHVRLRFVVHFCRLISGKPKPLACEKLQWVALADLYKYPFPAANQRMISALLKHFRLGSN